MGCHLWGCTELAAAVDSFGLPWWLSSKESACSAGDMGDVVRSLGLEDPLEEEMATYSNTLAWKIPWTEEPGRL